MWVWSF